MNAITLSQPVRLRLSSGALESLKWLALACMVVDHVNAAMFSRELGEWATVIGRQAFPLFAIVLGVNLGRVGSDHMACLRRLVLFGVAATPAYVLLFGQIGLWPLNVMFTFAVAVGLVLALEARQWQAVVALSIAAAFVEYWWPGVLLVVTAYTAARYGGNRATLAAGVFALVGLCVVNGNAWALLSVPLVVVADVVSPHVPRAGRFFWWFYPVHLAVLAFFGGSHVLAP